MKPREPRTTVLLPARLRVGGAWSNAAIRNLSRRGVCIELDAPPQRGHVVELRRGQAVVIGRVVWSEARRCGLRTQDALDLAALADGEAGGAPAPLPGQPASERRRTPRAALFTDPTRVRALSSMLQYVAVLGFGIGAALFVVNASVTALGTPLAQVAEQL